MTTTNRRGMTVAAVGVMITMFWGCAPTADRLPDVYVSTSPARRPPASPTPRTAPCTGSIAEYCHGKCPTYAESLNRVKERYCKARPPLERGGVVIHQVPVRADVKDCVGGYHSIISGSHYQGVGEYYDTNGNLIAAYRFSDAVGADCNGASASKTFGKIPTCSTELVRIDFCKQ